MRVANALRILENSIQILCPISDFALHNINDAPTFTKGYGVRPNKSVANLYTDRYKVGVH